MGPIRAASLMLVCFTLWGCGGGGGEAPPPPMPEVTLQAEPQTVVSGQTTVLTWTSKDATSCTASGGWEGSKAPSGSETSAALSAPAEFQLTCSGPGGSASAQATVSVTAAAPEFDYGTSMVALARNEAVRLSVRNSGGAAVSWSVTPDLPAGLMLDPADGTIYGTPTNVVRQTRHVITAENDGGRDSTVLKISVCDVLLEAGQTGEIISLQYSDSGDRLLSQGHERPYPPSSARPAAWILWDTATHAQVASGPSLWTDKSRDLVYPVALAGQTLVVDGPDGLVLRSASDGQPKATIASHPIWWKLSTDGSYIVAALPNALSLWTADGRLIGTRTGDYASAKAFAAAGEVRIANGPAGMSVIETISSADMQARVSGPFNGNFHSWFVNGERFLTNLDTTVWTYSAAGESLGVISLTTIKQLTGQLDWIWVTDFYSLKIYKVGGDGNPRATVSLSSLDTIVPVGGTIAVLDYARPHATRVDLTGPEPIAKEYWTDLPLNFLSAYGQDASGARWVLGNGAGVLAAGDETGILTQFFGTGAVDSIAGSDVRAAVATASGRIFILKPDSAQPEIVVPKSSSHAMLSSDGTRLAASRNENAYQYGLDQTFGTYSLPDGNLLAQWDLGSSLRDFHLCRCGSLLTQSVLDQPYQRLLPTTGGAPLWTGQSRLTHDEQEAVKLSSDGRRMAVPLETSTEIWLDGQLVTAVPGRVAGWVSGDRLITRNLERSDDDNYWIYHGSTLRDSTGASIVNVPGLPNVSDFQLVGEASVYSATTNALYTILTGAIEWQGPSSTRGAVVGDRFVYLYKGRVVSEPR